MINNKWKIRYSVCLLIFLSAFNCFGKEEFRYNELWKNYNEFIHSIEIEISKSKKSFIELAPIDINLTNNDDLNMSIVSAITNNQKQCLNIALYMRDTCLLLSMIEDSNKEINIDGKNVSMVGIKQHLIKMYEYNVSSINNNINVVETCLKTVGHQYDKQFYEMAKANIEDLKNLVQIIKIPIVTKFSWIV